MTGCTRVSEGCRNCYAERLTATRFTKSQKYAGLGKLYEPPKLLLDMAAAGKKFFA